MLRLQLMNVYFNIRIHKVFETTSVIEMQISENHSFDLINECPVSDIAAGSSLLAVDSICAKRS
jgi:hypothetical protein